MQRLIIRRRFSVGAKPNLPVTKILGSAIIGLAGYFGYDAIQHRDTSPEAFHKAQQQLALKAARKTAPKLTLAEFVAQGVGPIPGRSPDDFRKFVESEGKYSPHVPIRTAPPKPVELPRPAPVETHPVTVVPMPKRAETPPPVEPHKDTVLDSQIKQLEDSLAKAKQELAAEQQAREKELIQKLEDSIAAQMEAVLPRLSAHIKSPAHSSTAQALVQQMDFSKATAEDVKTKLESIITAYEHRIETLGLTHFELISDRLKLQKEKWRRRIDEVQRSYAEELAAMAAQRDNEWRDVLGTELKAAESHFSQQSELDRTHAQQEAALELTLKHKKEIEEITESLAKATEDRLALLQDILTKISDMEQIQAEHSRIIEKLKQVHVLHTTVESLQRTLTKDEGTLTSDLKTLEKLAEKDEVVAASLASLADVYASMVERGIPTIAQIQRQYRSTADRARFASLITEKDFLGYLTAKLTYWLLPSATKTVDDGDTYGLLRAAGEALDRGDLRQSIMLLRQLQGYPREEAEEFIQDAAIRLSVASALEALSQNAVGLVNDITKKQLS